MALKTRARPPSGPDRCADSLAWSREQMSETERSDQRDWCDQERGTAL